MIEGQKIIAFTPCGRKRYMDLLAGYVLREHERGHIDEWILFNNAYFTDDATYADQLAAHWPWVKIFRGAEGRWWQLASSELRRQRVGLHLQILQSDDGGRWRYLHSARRRHCVH